MKSITTGASSFRILFFLGFFLNFLPSYCYSLQSSLNHRQPPTPKQSPISITTTNVQANHKLPIDDTSPEQLVIIATHKTDLKSPLSLDIISQAATTFIFTFDLDKSIDLVTLPGLPLKLYPTSESKMSTFATFLPQDADGYFSINGVTDDDDEQQKEPLLWNEYSSNLCGSAVAIIETHPESQVRTVTIQTWINLQKLPEIRIELPHKMSSYPTKSAYAEILGKADSSSRLQLNSQSPANPDDCSIKKAILHYYRGIKTDCSGYTTVQEISDYIRTMFLSVLSPFVLLGILLICIAICVFTWLHVFYSEQEEDDYDDSFVDEKHRIFLV